MPEQIIQIYRGRPSNFGWIGFGSGSGTNLRECAKVIKPKLIVCDKPGAGLLSLEELADVPRIVLDGYKACGSWKKAQRDPELMAEYERKSIQFNWDILGEIEKAEREYGFETHLIVLGGYMRLIKDPLLLPFKDKIANMHPAHLGILIDAEEPGMKIRKYTGGDAVYDAIKAGETRTKSSVILVDEKVDHGEIIAQGAWHDVDPQFLEEYYKAPPEEEENLLRKYVDGVKEPVKIKGHQEIQKEKSDWPSFRAVIRMIADARVALGSEKVFHNEWRRVYIDGVPMPYEGFQVDKQSASASSSGFKSFINK